MSYKERSDKAWKMALMMESLGLKPEIQAKQIILVFQFPCGCFFTQCKAPHVEFCNEHVSFIPLFDFVKHGNTSGKWQEIKNPWGVRLWCNVENDKLIWNIKPSKMLNSEGGYYDLFELLKLKNIRLKA